MWGTQQFKNFKINKNAKFVNAILCLSPHEAINTCEARLLRSNLHVLSQLFTKFEKNLSQSQESQKSIGYIVIMLPKVVCASRSKTLFLKLIKLRL